MSVLEIDHVDKAFGSHQVLNKMTMDVPEHCVFGFVGQNGAGKTTTMKIALGLLKADGGVVRVCGEQVTYGNSRTNRHVGYLPDVPEFYGYMRPMEYLRLCGQVTGLSSGQIATRGGELLEMVGLAGVKRRIGGFSRGMKQRLGIAQALLNQPELVICDEPTSALDPIGRKEVLDILASLKDRTTVVFSTHVLSDVERICDQVAILHGGRIALAGTIAEIKAQHRHHGFVVECANPADADRLAGAAELKSMGINTTVEGATLTVMIAQHAGGDGAPRADGAAGLVAPSVTGLAGVAPAAPSPQFSQSAGSAPSTWSGSDQAGGQLLLGALTRLDITPVRFEQMEPTLESLFAEVVK
ncbi:MAG: ABC transporter ATP-binding protein [Propionibacteriaceae bacterium]|jgi:ABC-2 type transport system ATP-binding protein|nr:ABC transporter ATP-binding protein [Propionibacteriaceae bacterium]